MKTPRSVETCLILVAAFLAIPAAHAGPLSAEALSRLEAASKDVFGSTTEGAAGSLREFEERFAAARETVEGFIPLPNLKIDTRGRDLRFDMLRAQTEGGLTLNVESRSHMGRLPYASVALADRGLAATLRTEVSHDLRRISLGGSWDIQGASLRGAVGEDGRYEAGVSVPFMKSQSLDYSVRSGPATDHRVGWSLRVKL